MLASTANITLTHVDYLIFYKNVGGKTDYLKNAHHCEAVENYFQQPVICTGQL